MPELSCMVHRVGDLESRTEEYEMSYAVEGAQPRGLRVKYQAARAAISDADPGLRGPTDEALSQFAWRTIQSAKYEGGEPVTSRLQL